MAEVCETCKNESRICTLEKMMDANGSAHKDIYGLVYSLKETVVRNDEKYNAILALLGEMRSDIADLKGKSGKRWDTLITAIITAVVASGFSVMATLMFLR
jgi:hypothetical protein